MADKPTSVERTDPWRWYCRLCGATGEKATEEDRTYDAMAHLADAHPVREHLGWAEAGRLAHVWNYGQVVTLNGR